jgi:hypothetical protein
MAGVESPFLARSVAWTANVCVPDASPEYVCGLVHLAKAFPSSWHAKVAVGSGLVKVKLALSLALGFAGLLEMVVSGGVASTENGTAAEVAVVPWVFVADTRTEYVPSANGAVTVTW